MNDQLTSIVIVNYNGKKHLDECLRALDAHSERPIEVIVVDNASTDGSADYLEVAYPQIKLLRNDVNVGYSKGINVGASCAAGKYLVFLNADIIVQPNWLAPLTDFLAENPLVGAVNPCILLYDTPTVINALGQRVHVTGLGFNRKLNAPIELADGQPTCVSGLQGGAVALRTEVFRAVGEMNEFYFLYHEDVEFSLRLLKAGYSLYVIPAAQVLHKYSLHMTPSKIHWLERHRWVTLLLTFQPLTLLLLLPLLLTTEALMFGYCLLHGTAYLRAKHQAVWWVFAERQTIKMLRRRSQSVRVKGDWQVIRSLAWAYEWSQFAQLARQRGTMWNRARTLLSAAR